MPPAIVWFRRDLRTHDHPALREALARHGEIVPFFCLDDRLLHGRHASGPRTQFMLECLHDLDASLDGRLVVRRGPPERELARLARETGAEDVYFSADVSPFARGRGRRVHATGLRLHARPGLTVAGDVGDYGVFAPFHRRWLKEPRREVLGAPRKLRGPRAGGDGIPALEELGLRQEVEEPMTGGESEGRRRLANFLRGPVETYGEDEQRSSRLSPYLHFGCVSPREVESRLPGGEGPEELRRQLAWRDYFHRVLLHHPENATQEHQPRYRGSLAWEHDDERLHVWQQGRTGYPLVDAGMRQLRREGWMHNRARLVVASFLTKHLGIDWRLGERWFMRLLIDGDEANNNGNWQWIASVGVDPQPAYRRIYNPARQMERFDPRGTYVRRNVPELRDVPDRHLREPWTMPDELQRSAGCVIGRDYPAPIVDHLEARREALERYRAAAA
jgi:deoxyribodipyrimidine photo-lyase